MLIYLDSAILIYYLDGVGSFQLDFGHFEWAGTWDVLYES